MAKIKYDLFSITCLTNMHVGSGDINFGVVDNLVQKDPVTDLPTINSSSLKGALREFFEEEIGDSDLVMFVFGSSPQALHSSTAGQGVGNYRFFSANLLSIPVRSNKRPFFSAVSPFLLKTFVRNIDLFKINCRVKTKIEGLANNIHPGKENPLIFEKPDGKITLEDLAASYQDPATLDMKKIQTFLGENIALFHDDDLKELCTELPVIARNYLENGISRNLWYEEVVPRETRFYFVVGIPCSEETRGTHDAFLKGLAENIIQVGANASIGYGYVRIEKIKEKKGK